MALLGGSHVDVTDLWLPGVVSESGNGSNTVTATSWAALPTTPLAAQIVNPHPTAPMLCMVTFGAWLIGSGAAVRAALEVSGSLSVSPGIGGGLATGWGQVVMSGTATLTHAQAVATIELPPSVNPAVFTARAYRDSATGTQNVNYPVIEIVPLRYLTS